MIQLQNVSKTFRTPAGEVKAVQEVSLEIQQGEIYGIIGFSGAGKSTLVRCINLLEKPTAGRVVVAGQELTALRPKQLRAARRSIGMIFQQFNLLPGRTVFQNVAYPLRYTGLSRAEIAQRVRELLALVEISEKETAYPSQLSGGQKQRVAIARALANDPKVLLCDEATSALDPTTTKSILTLLKRLNTQLGLTVVVITHEMAVVKEICHRVAVMENGRVVESGEIFDIFSSPEQEITRRFTRTNSSLQKIYELLDAGSPIVDIGEGEVIVRLNYLEKTVSEPLISTLSRVYNVDFNIIYSDIEIVANAPVGGVVGIMAGTRGQMDAAIRWLTDKNVGVEVIRDGRYTAKSVS